MPKIQVEYEVTRRIAVEIDVPEQTVRELEDSGDIDILRPYDVTEEIMYRQCNNIDGWEETDFAVTDMDKDRRVIPWSWE